MMPHLMEITELFWLKNKVFVGCLALFIKTIMFLVGGT